MFLCFAHESALINVRGQHARLLDDEVVNDGDEDMEGEELYVDSLQLYARSTQACPRREAMGRF